MGPQWWAMGRELLEHEPVVRAAVERVDAALRHLAGWSVIDRLRADESASLIQETKSRSRRLFAIQVGLADCGSIGASSLTPSWVTAWRSGGAPCRGILTLDEAVTVIYHRSRLQQALAGSGGMLAAGISPTEASELRVAAKPRSRSPPSTVLRR